MKMSEWVSKQAKNKYGWKKSLMENLNPFKSLKELFVRIKESFDMDQSKSTVHIVAPFGLE